MKYLVPHTVLTGSCRRTSFRCRRRTAFTLIELMAVMTIMIVLASFAGPAFTSLAVGSRLTRAGQLVADQLYLARQEAVTKNRDVQVRFITIGGTVRGVQLWRVDDSITGPVTNAVARMTSLPDGVVVSPDPQFSPLLSAGTTGTMSLPPYGTVSFISIRIRSNGGTENSITAANNFLTLQNANGTTSGSPGANYYTVQINPITGKVVHYQP